MSLDSIKQKAGSNQSLKSLEYVEFKKKPTVYWIVMEASTINLVVAYLLHICALQLHQDYTNPYVF